MSYCDLSVTFDLGSAKMFLNATFETHFFCDKAIWIAETATFI